MSGTVAVSAVQCVLAASRLDAALQEAEIGHFGTSAPANSARESIHSMAISGNCLCHEKAYAGVEPANHEPDGKLQYDSNNMVTAPLGTGHFSVEHFAPRYQIHRRFQVARRARGND